MRTYQTRCFNLLRSQERSYRQNVLLDTIESFQANYNHYKAQASHNLNTWLSLYQPQPPIVDVVSMDWGDATLLFTKKYAHTFCVLNMANPTYPGGGYLYNCVAQEENMFRRSDCFFSITDNLLDSELYSYNTNFSNLLQAHNNLVYLDTNPRLCIKSGEQSQYKLLDNSNIFSFLELRASAQDLRNGNSLNIDNAVHRIEAQFDTLLQHNIQHVIFSAFGCGAFNNPPKTIANIYKQQILNYKKYFKAIVFAIYYPGYGPDNYTTFSKVLLANS